MSNELIIVSNRLPVTIAVDGATQKSSGGLVSALAGVAPDEYAMRWLGWPGREVAQGEQATVAAALEREQGCTPVFLPESLARDFYEGFANSSLWPLLHGLPTYFQYRSQWWDAYRRANEQFAERICASATAGSLVWVHDYQLMLLPRMLKQSRPDLRVGFFLHTPFPSYDVFRCHPDREALLTGVLGADLIGFHTFGYLRHLRSNVLRLLGTESDISSVEYDGHRSELGVYPIGIDAAGFERTLRTDAFRERCAASAASYAGKRLILSVERLDYTKGIVRRLDAIDLFLSRLTPAERDTVQFLFVSVPTRSGVDQYRELCETVEHRVGRINGRYATLHNSPVHFMHQSVGFTELCALYAVADIALVTPLIDGMNLVAKEFIACQPNVRACPSRTAGDGRDGPGVLILSEFAGAAQELPNAVTVNPYDVPGMAAAIELALAMPAEERRRRMRPMRERVFTYDAAAWARDFLGKLSARPEPSGRGAGRVEEAAEQLTSAVVGGDRVALFLDYDGTLREIVRDPASATPTPDVRILLEHLTVVPNLDVIVISGRTVADLERFFDDEGGSRFGLVAEHGAAIRRPGDLRWQQVDRNLDLRWMEQVREVMALYERSTPGTHVEEKRTGLVWHYRQADPEFGRWKANQLVDELSNAAAGQPLEVRHGRKIVEASSVHLSKGAAVERLLANEDYKLVMLAGDDTTDESMFRLADHDPRLITVRVGSGKSSARYRVSSPAAFRNLLRSILPECRLIEAS
jgi:trehalose 6-phosphate synthase/phosphatase